MSSILGVESFHFPENRLVMKDIILEWAKIAKWEIVEQSEQWIRLQKDNNNRWLTVTGTIKLEYKYDRRLITVEADGDKYTHKLQENDLKLKVLRKELFIYPIVGNKVARIHEELSKVEKFIPCRKRAFPDIKSGLVRIEEIHKQETLKNRVKPIRVYNCEKCGLYHLTSKPQQLGPIVSLSEKNGGAMRTGITVP